MKKLLLFIFCLFSITACGVGGGGGGSPSSPPNTPPQTTAYYEISGDAGGVPGATIALTGSLSMITTSDASGGYIFTDVPNGSYTVTPVLSGYTFSPTSAVVTVSGVSIAGVNFTATANSVPAYSISGTVSGTAGATINLIGTSIASVTTDGSGNYSFSGLANGSYTVTPVLSGYTFSPINVDVTVSGGNVAGVNFTATAVIVGTLDTSFGSSGVLNICVSAWPGTDEGRGVAIQPDGKFVVVGRGGDDSFLLRVNADGSLDTSFGSSGIIVIPNYSYSSVVIQSDGKIVVGGAAIIDVAVARYDDTGVLDPTFGVGGITTIDIGATSDFINGLALQADGKILAAGQSGTNSAIIRIMSSGSPDATFGAGGVVITTTSVSSAATAVAVQSDGKIVTSGYTSVGWLVTRYNSDGSLDTGFATNGKATTVIGASFNAYYKSDFAYGIAVDTGGKIVVVGGTGGSCVPPNCFSEYKVAVARYNADGSLDTSFGSSGIQTGGTGFARRVAIQSDGKVVVVGKQDSIRIIVNRFTVNGLLDTSFSADGVIEEDVNVGTHVHFYWSEGYDLVLQPDGKIVVVGFVCTGVNGVNSDILLLRYR